MLLELRHVGRPVSQLEGGLVVGHGAIRRTREKYSRGKQKQKENQQGHVWALRHGYSFRSERGSEAILTYQLFQHGGYFEQCFEKMKRCGTLAAS
jgi:hypothetical protein